MFEIRTSLQFKKQRKKLNQNDKDLVDEVVFILSNNQILDKKYKDHQLKGNLKKFRECHIKPDLLLIYLKENDILVLTCIGIGSHSDLFKK
ncbi:type II toxin-antitoxin system YafQ family toxin [Arcobacter vandammei]|uniref:type II toxin-antitoxin system YafQ family toxin n=1 Tax=Arcobacter vandammei TaxID=2782243 RepID=UPI0018DF4B9A|nr:type II toxin-antitoxin system YafQ family toxin [Arcobacter vandammei]